jgi:hypothetical protein
MSSKGWFYVIQGVEDDVKWTTANETAWNMYNNLSVKNILSKPSRCEYKAQVLKSSIIHFTVLLVNIQLHIYILWKQFTKLTTWIISQKNE